jgi:membrane protease YdiL (CAAX protease family)
MTFRRPLQALVRTAFASISGKSRQEVARQEVPIASPIRPILPEGEAILQPPMDNTPNDAPDAPPTRIPHLGHAFLFLSLTLALLLIMRLVTQAISPSAPAGQSVNISPKIVILSEVFTYLATLAASWFIFPLLWQRSFISGIQANASAARRNALRLIPLGIALSLVVQASSSLITMPKDVPMDDFFRTRSDIWIVTVFGIFLAPLFEEILFRGFFLPAFAIAYDWLSLPRSDAALTEWHSTNKITTPAWAFAAVLSSVAFAALHGQQIGFAWPVLILLFCVSLILTTIRLRLRSILASTLVHASYNFAIFVTAFVGTGGYRHLDKLTH